MSLNGINAGYAATAATAIEKVQKADKATASSKESTIILGISIPFSSFNLLKNPLKNPKPVLPTKQPSVLLLNRQKMPHWLPS